MVMIKQKTLGRGSRVNDMELITWHSMERAREEAVRLWSLASTQFPVQNRAIQESLNYMMLESVSAFSFNARRATEALSDDCKFQLHQRRFVWEAEGEEVSDFRDALNRTIHSREMEIGYVELPPEMSVISGGANVIPFVRVKTDKWPLALVDVFALSHCYLYEVFPKLRNGNDEAWT